MLTDLPSSERKTFRSSLQMFGAPKTEAYYKVAGTKAWQIGPLGRMLQFWEWLAVLVVLSVIIIWIAWDGSEADRILIDSKWLTIGLLGILGSAFIVGLRYLKWRTIRSLEVKGSLHEITHGLRDWNTTLHKEIQSGNVRLGSGYNDLVENMLATVCENVAKHFRLLKDYDGINVAIRLAAWDAEKEMVVYETVARSRGFSQGREDTTEAIPINKGIPRFLRAENDAQGILIYYDMKKAIEKRGTFFPTYNDKQYSGDIKSMMVAPLNAWVGNDEDMIGIMFVTSKLRNTFDIKDVDQFAFIADLVATSISTSSDIAELGMSNKSLKGRK